MFHSRYSERILTAARLWLGNNSRFLGKCGHAYFVPHFTNSGYSGNVVEVELHTNALGSVRLHGVVTDFADFYATGGVGPYEGQVCDPLETTSSSSERWRFLSGMSLLRQKLEKDEMHVEVTTIVIKRVRPEHELHACYG